MNEATHILIVDDDHRVRDLLRRYFEQEGFQVSEAADGAGLRGELAAHRFDLIFLDLGLPGEDGLILAREIRAESDVPIIIVTGKGEMVDRVVGLEMGADDYITKPFHLREVLARARSVLRRSAHATAQGAGPSSERNGDQVRFDGWQLDLTKRELVDPEGAPVALTTGEFNLLAAFVQRANRPLNRDQLMDLARDRDWTPFDRSIDTQVGRLRKKIERDPKNPEIIKTVRGVGYIFTAKVQTG